METAVGIIILGFILGGLVLLSSSGIKHKNQYFSTQTMQECQALFESLFNVKIKGSYLITWSQDKTPGFCWIGPKTKDGHNIIYSHFPAFLAQVTHLDWNESNQIKFREAWFQLESHMK
jgi:hypothetical protein